MIFDVTHSVQRPGGLGDRSGGDAHFIDTLGPGGRRRRRRRPLHGGPREPGARALRRAQRLPLVAGEGAADASAADAGGGPHLSAGRGPPCLAPPSRAMRSLRPVAIAWLFTVAWSATPYLKATLAPPPGQRFVGAFYFVDDFYNYLSYAQQAEDGSFLFRNKVLLDDHPPALVNLEWALVGNLGRLLGGGASSWPIASSASSRRPVLLFVFDLWLLRLGLPESHRLPALLLLTTAGGLGGLLFSLGSRPLTECLDLYAGLFPSLGLLVNPHFVAGTALLAWALLCYEDATSPRAWLVATLVGTSLALVRPYDFVMLGLVRGTAVLVLEPVRRWPRALVPLVGLLPAVAYLYWLFYVNPAFAFYAGAPYGFPARKAFAWALIPAALLALTALARPFASREERRAMAHLAIWAGFGVLVIVVQPVHFSLQFLAGIGFPLLALGAAGLARFSARVTFATAVAFSPTLVVALRFVLTPNTLWLAPRENMEIVEALESECHPGDILMAPPSLGVFAYGLTACRAYASHPIAPDYERRRDDIQRFSGASPRERLAFLDEARVRHLILPGDAGPIPVAWLGPAAPFQRVAVAGSPGRWSLYERRPPE